MLFRSIQEPLTTKMDFKFEVNSPSGSNIVTKQLVFRHRNSPAISHLIDHFLFKEVGLLNPSQDQLLEETSLPPGDLPIWLPMKTGQRNEVFFRFMSIFLIKGQSVTLIHRNDLTPLETQWCLQKKWRTVKSTQTAGIEDEVVLIFDCSPNLEVISREKIP